jgi:DNA end-binding protein Ku
VTDAELEALEPEKSREIDLRRFVDRKAIVPLYFDRAYYLMPAGDSNKAYRLLASVLESSERAGIATFVMHDREYLIAIIASDGVLRGETLRFAGEVRDDPDGLDDRTPKVDKSRVEQYMKAIRARTRNAMNLDDLEDTRAERLKALAEKKRKEGRDVVEIPHDVKTTASEDGEEENSDGDLLDSIRRSLSAAKSKTPKRAKAKPKKHATK